MILSWFVKVFLSDVKLARRYMYVGPVGLTFFFFSSLPHGGCYIRVSFVCALNLWGADLESFLRITLRLRRFEINQPSLLYYQYFSANVSIEGADCLQICGRHSRILKLINSHNRSPCRGGSDPYFTFSCMTLTPDCPWGSLPQKIPTFFGFVSQF